MNILLDKITRRKIVAIKNEERAFYVEFPVDTDTAELYGVVSEIKDRLWQALEEEKKLAEEKEYVEKDYVEKVTEIPEA